MESELEQLQRMIDALFHETASVSRLDVVVRAEAMDMPPRVLELVELLPPGQYKRQRLCDQLNSAIVGHGWGGSLGTVE
jgi:hypothetical protein